jgi:hypothetical protein
MGEFFIYRLYLDFPTNTINVLHQFTTLHPKLFSSL